MTNKRVLTIQDISCLGQCSLTVALPIISACGVETIILPSAVLSSHTGGFKGFTFRDLTDDIPGIMQHWQKENQYFDCLYSGYLGNQRQIAYVEDLMTNCLTSNAVRIVDPAMADHGKLYTGFQQEFVKAMASLCGKADIILPNITEAAFLTDSEFISGVLDESYILSLLQKLSALGAKKIILKGVCYEETQTGVAVYDTASEDLQYYFTERMPKNSHGTGDCYAAAFTGALMQGLSEYDAAKTAADFVVECLKKTLPDESHWYGVKFEKALPFLVNQLNN